MSQKRIDPWDGASYTWEELHAFYRDAYKAEEIVSYWESCKVVKAKRHRNRKCKGKGAEELTAKAKEKAKAEARQPALVCGLITDVQYGPFPDRGQRRYFHSLSVLGNAVAFFKLAGVDFAAHLGDIVDWRNSKAGVAKAGDDSLARRSLSDIRHILCEDELEWCCILGNHELYNFARQGDVLTRQPFVPVPAVGDKDRAVVAPGAKALEELGAGKRAYYSFKPRSEQPWRIVILDPFDVSAMSHGRDLNSALPPGCQHYTNAQAEESGNEAIQAICPEAQIRCRSTAPLAVRRFAKQHESECCDMNGAISDHQFAWLQNELKSATEQKERVIILCHVLLSQRPTDSSDSDQRCEKCSLWNFPKLVRLFHSRIGQCVAACIHGHDHKGGYWQDPTGLHNIVLQAALEAKDSDGPGPFVVLEAYNMDRLVFRGYGNSALFGVKAEVDDAASTRELPVRPLDVGGDCACEWCQVVPSEGHWWE